MRPNAGEIEQSRRRQVLLAPPSFIFNSGFEDVRYETDSYYQILSDIQRLRGRVALHEGAIRKEDLGSDGRHEVPADLVSWHIATLDKCGSVVACARLHVHNAAVRFEHLGVSRSSLAKCPQWGRRLRSAVESELRRTRSMGYHFVEAGGWVLDESVRHTVEAFRIALGAFAWGALIGGGIGITTATLNNHSADILRKVGGRPIRHDGVELPRYFDPQYDCNMQILSFETGGYTPRFHDSVVQYTRELSKTPLICRTPAPVPAFFPMYAARAAHASAA